MKPSLYKTDQRRTQNNPDAKAFNLNFRYIYYVLLINNPDFANWIPLIFPPKKLEIKETTETASSHRHLFHSKNICPLLFLTSR
jgi:hypothetical protein